MQRALSGRRRARLCSIVRWALPATCRGEADGAGGSRAHDSYQGALRFARQAIPNGPNAGMAKSGVIASPFRIANTVGLHWMGQVVADIGVFANDDLKLANCHDSAIYLVGRWHSSVHFAHLPRRACAQDSRACSACDANADGAISAPTDKDVIQHDAFIARAKQSSPRSCPEQFGACQLPQCDADRMHELHCRRRRSRTHLRDRALRSLQGMPRPVLLWHNSAQPRSALTGAFRVCLRRLTVLSSSALVVRH